ncbi:crAss001_48 related protein [Cycloclasticus pugetii]|nr:hypothetical protein SAMN05519226_1488 [Cycloclasticus pugetii]
MYRTTKRAQQALKARERMKEQCEIMWQYSEILGKRIAAF